MEEITIKKLIEVEENRIKTIENTITTYKSLLKEASEETDHYFEIRKEDKFREAKKKYIFYVNQILSIYSTYFDCKRAINELIKQLEKGEEDE